MAEGTSAPNYRLSQGTQRRVQEAGLGGDARKHLQNAAMADELGNIATDVTDQIIEKQEDTAAREEAWDVGFDAMGDRGSWASGELYDQFQTVEAGYRDEYLEAVRKGDKKAQARMLKDQGARASGLEGWKGTMETAKQINDSPGGWADSLGAEDKEILKALTKLDGETAITKFGDQGEMVFDIKLKSGKTVTKTRREIDEMVAQGIYPAELELAMIKTNKGQVQNGLDGGLFDLESTAGEVALSITDDQLPALMNQKWKFGGGGTFRDHIKSHPDFEAAYADGGYMSSIDPNSDGTLTSEEIAGFEPSDMDLIVDEMEKDPSTAKGYVADWMARTQQQNWQKGSDERARRAETKTTNKGGGSDVPAAIQIAEYEKRQRAIEEQKQIERYEALRKPIVIDGEPIGSLSQYSKSDGEWMVSPNPGDPNKKMKVKDYIDTRGMGLTGPGDTPYEPLTKKASTKLYNEIISMLEGEAGPSGLLEGGSGTMEFD